MYETTYITSQGEVLAAKTLESKKLRFSKFSIGSGEITDPSSDNIKALQSLINPVLDFDITKISRDTDTQVTVRGLFKNTDVEESFYLKELGLYAIDPDTEEEILFAYINFGDKAEYINNSISEKKEIYYNMIITVDNADNVTITIDPTTVYVTEKELEEKSVIVSATEPTTNEKVWIQKGKNLFNKNTITSGKRLTNGNSGTYDSSGSATSEHIEILPNTDYCISNYTAYHIYDKSGIVIQQDFVDSATTKNVKTLENAYTMRISSLITDLDSVQLEQGSTATEYEEYIEEVLWLKNNNGMFEPFYKKNEATSKFVYLGGKTFESTAVAGTAETFELLESAKNYDLLFIQASPDHEGGTGLLFPKASNGSNVIIHVGPGVGGNYDGIIRVWQEINDRTTIRMKLVQKGNSRPANNFGIKNVYGIKF